MKKTRSYYQRFLLGMLPISILTLFMLFILTSKSEASNTQEVDVTRVVSGPIAGGYWIRGYQWAWPWEQVVSEYKHYTKRSHASVVNGNGVYHSGGWTKGKGQFSRAKANWIPWGTNKTYYDSKK